MKISSKYTGLNIREHRMIVSWRDSMSYAAAIDDNNERYFDDLRPAGLIAPPMFSVAATWRVVGHLARNIETNDFPLEIFRTQVHYSEWLEFHAPVRPGDELTIKGVIAAVLPHRAGTHIVLRFEAHNQHGTPVYTEYFGGIMRDVECEDGGAGAETLPATPNMPATGSYLWRQPITIDALRAHIYDGCADIHFPIHTSRKHARQAGLPGILLQGTATLAYAARELVNRNADGDPTRLQVLGCRFSGMVLPPAGIMVRLLSTEHKEGYTDLFFDVLGDGDQAVIKDGYARISGSQS